MKKNILIIDDNPVNNMDYVKALESKYDVDSVMALVQATRKLKHKKYNLIVIDIMMPIQGLEITDELSTGLYYYKTVENLIDKNTPIIFWSHLTNDNFNKFFKNNPSDKITFLHKVENFDHLKNEIDKILK